MWGNNSTPPAALLKSFGYSLWLLCVVPVCGRTKKGVRDTIIFNMIILMMSQIASAPFFTFNFSRFQHAFLRVYLYFILERLIFNFKVPLVTEIFYYQRLMFEFARNVRTWPSAIKQKSPFRTPQPWRRTTAPLPPPSNLLCSFHRETTPTPLPSMRPENWGLFCVPAIFHFHEESFPPTPITMLPVQKKGTSKKRALHAIY